MAYIELNKVSFTYPGGAVPAVRNLSLKVEKGSFTLLFGASGSGKSTLLRMLKKEIQPNGVLAGDIMIDGKPAEIAKSEKIGFVFQDPENQVVADTVLHELVFGLENIGLPTSEMRNRVAEMVHFFGAEPLLHRKVEELSGGKKQQMNLASVLLMQPDILLLDEPTAQLDPVSAREFTNMLVRLNEEFGMTIIVAEHRLEDFVAAADKVVMMEKGQAVYDGCPEDSVEWLWDSGRRAYIPSLPSFFKSVDGEGQIPLNVRDARKWLQQCQITSGKEKIGGTSKDPGGKESVLRAENIHFGYGKDADFVLKGLDFSLEKGSFYALLGGNGSGKSTFLKIAAGIYKPYKGKVLLNGKRMKGLNNRESAGKIGYLPQNPKLFFLHDTVGKELDETAKQWGRKPAEGEPILERLGISHLRDSHPYDLSGGEIQKAALACILLRSPDILLLDEPTKGLDAISKERLAGILQELREEGKMIVMATHDVEFAARHAVKCGMMFQGIITSEAEPKEFFQGNFFYTTMIQKLFRQVPEYGAVTLEEAVKCFGIK
ncbi:ABC transporter ATP-binding protein [Mesobacillus zeae]|uniref:ATP-binding cassette domain-containing protein n=1 Tax=Mesobacillus zeae TaxID=1917180 RepID=A0A398B379_9BACI|nr:ATP-binding cassette domain-containing protein [Mesobacillus zeae]RID84252.1 ATP-binding cassette domain-containing protein [Mesobacillus zeae]